MDTVTPFKALVAIRVSTNIERFTSKRPLLLGMPLCRFLVAFSHTPPRFAARLYSRCYLPMPYAPNFSVSSKIRWSTLGIGWERENLLRIAFGGHIHGYAPAPLSLCFIDLLVILSQLSSIPTQVIYLNLSSVIFDECFRPYSPMKWARGAFLNKISSTTHQHCPPLRSLPLEDLYAH